MLSFVSQLAAGFMIDTFFGGYIHIIIINTLFQKSISYILLARTWGGCAINYFAGYNVLFKGLLNIIG